MRQVAAGKALGLAGLLLQQLTLQIQHKRIVVAMLCIGRFLPSLLCY